MRTVLAFVLGVSLVTAAWVMAGPSTTTEMIRYPAPDGPAILDRLGEPVPDFDWRGPGGEESRLSDLLGEGPVVVAIRDLSCPVSQRYGPTLGALEEAFEADGVRFLYVDLTPSSVEWTVQMSKDQATLGGTYVRDVGEDFFEALAPRTTTEAFIIDAEGILRYRGAVDDQFGVDFARQSPRHRFLFRALETVLHDEVPTLPSTFAPGCYLQHYGLPGIARAPAEAPNWSRDVEPLVEENCVSCHSDGGAGPFALDGPDALIAHRDEIRSVVAQNRMPPWPANPEIGSWANDARLTSAEKATLLSWLESGTGRGAEAGGADPTGARRAAGAWRHGRPDAVLSMREPFLIRDEDGLSLKTFYIPTDFGEDRWVSAVEILPSAPASVVQAVVLIESPDTPPSERSLGLEGFFAGYAPGYNGGVFPSGTAKRLPAGAWLKLQVHYQPQAAPIEDRTRIGLTFADAPPRHELETRSAYATGFEIPAHTSHHAVTAEHRFAVDGAIYSFSPHMHLRGSAIRYVLVDPRGEEQVLLDIPRYYFQFRLRYEAADPIPVEAGSTLRVTGWYDNSEANLANPDPSEPAAFGSELTDELLIGYFDFVAADAPAGVLAEPDERDR